MRHYRRPRRRGKGRDKTTAEALGNIVRLQVQRASLKTGQRPWRRYDPAPILAVPVLCLSEDGVTGLTERGERVVDVHHRDHPVSRNRAGSNGISVTFTSHYDAMRARFGGELANGLAGENVLVCTDRSVGEEELRDGILIEDGQGALVRLERVVVAEPCVEFGRYALRYPNDARSDRTVTEALSFLGGGMRGYYASYVGDPAPVRLGDRLYRL